MEELVESVKSGTPKIKLCRSWEYFGEAEELLLSNGYVEEDKDESKGEGKEEKDEIWYVRAPSKGFTSFFTSSRVKKVGAMAVVGSSAFVAAPLVIPAAVAAIGFGSGGIVAGSSAAALMSSYGGTVAAGSLCATLQSIGAAGIGIAGQTILGAAASVISGAIAYAL